MNVFNLPLFLYFFVLKSDADRTLDDGRWAMYLHRADKGYGYLCTNLKACSSYLYDEPRVARDSLPTPSLTQPVDYSRVQIMLGCRHPIRNHFVTKFRRYYKYLRVPTSPHLTKTKAFANMAQGIYHAGVTNRKCLSVGYSVQVV